MAVNVRCPAISVMASSIAGLFSLSSFGGFIGGAALRAFGGAGGGVRRVGVGVAEAGAGVLATAGGTFPARRRPR